MNYSDYFRCDPSSPSGLVWAKNIYNGRARNILVCSEGDSCGGIHKDGHWSVAFRFGDKQIRRYCHRIIWELTYGECDPKLFIDHINGVRSDNSLDNLRLVTRKTNSRNQKMNVRNTSGKTGVSPQEVNGYCYYVASWVDDDKRKHAKRFSIGKLGDEVAFKMASEYRNKMIESINDSTYNQYTERHVGV